MTNAPGLKFLGGGSTPACALCQNVSVSGFLQYSFSLDGLCIIRALALVLAIRGSRLREGDATGALSAKWRS